MYSTSQECIIEYIINYTAPLAVKKYVKRKMFDDGIVYIFIYSIVTILFASLGFSLKRMPNASRSNKETELI